MTTTQPDLFSMPPTRPVEDVAGLARRTDPDTSRDAAAAISGRAEREILPLFVEHGPMTDDELCAVYPKYPPSVKSARSRLLGHGLIEDSGLRRASGRGRPQIVWQVKNPAHGSLPLPASASREGSTAPSPTPPGELA